MKKISFEFDGHRYNTNKTGNYFYKDGKRIGAREFTTAFADYESQQEEAEKTEYEFSDAIAWMEAFKDSTQDEKEDSNGNETNVEGETTAESTSIVEINAGGCKEALKAAYVKVAGSEPVTYAAMDIDRNSFSCIAKEGCEAALFTVAAAARTLVCGWLAVSWIIRKIKAGIQAAVAMVFMLIAAANNAVCGWITEAFDFCVQSWKFWAAFFVEVENFIAPVFCGILAAAARAWEFRNEIIKEVEA